MDLRHPQSYADVYHPRRDRTLRNLEGWHPQRRDLIRDPALASAPLSTAIAFTFEGTPVNMSLPPMSDTTTDGQAVTTTNGSWSGITPIAVGHKQERARCRGLGPEMQEKAGLRPQDL